MQEPAGHARAEVHFAAEHLADGPHQRFGRFLLGDVAHRPGLQDPLGEERFVVHRGDEGLDARIVGLDLFDQVDAVAGLQREVDHHHVGADPFQLLHGFGHVGGLAADFQVGLVGDDVGHAAADQGMVVDQQHRVLAAIRLSLLFSAFMVLVLGKRLSPRLPWAVRALVGSRMPCFGSCRRQGATMVTRVPRPGAASIRIVRPATAPARGCSTGRSRWQPVPRFGSAGSKPAPSSETTISISPSDGLATVTRGTLARRGVLDDVE